MRAEPIALAAPSVLAAEVAAGLGLTLSEAARRLPAGSGGRPVHPATLTRWIKRGTRTADGRVVKLEALPVGRKLVTSERALTAYLAALASPAEAAGPSQTPAQRLRTAEDAQLELARRGL